LNLEIKSFLQAFTSWLENGSPTGSLHPRPYRWGRRRGGTWMWFRRHYQVLTCSENHL